MLNTFQTPDPACNNSVSHWLSDTSGEYNAPAGPNSTSCEKHFEPNEHLFVEGKKQTHVYHVLSGVVALYKLTSSGKRQICSFVYPGDIVGLNADGVFSSNAEALSGGVTVRCIQVNVIDSLMRREPEFAQTLLRQNSEELNETWDRLLSLGRQSAMEKLASFLLRLSKRNERHGRDPVELQIPMKRSDIADFLGLTIETVSRNFTRLKQRGVIECRSITSIHILKPEVLERLSRSE